MKRYWVSWWSGYYEDEGCTTPPFQVWISGQKDRDNERNSLSLCAVVDAESEIDIWAAVNEHFPDYTVRFAHVVAIDFVPGDRFPDFRNKTSLN